MSNETVSKEPKQMSAEEQRDNLIIFISTLRPYVSSAHLRVGVELATKLSTYEVMRIGDF